MECNRYELLKEKYLDIYKELNHSNQQYKENCRPIKHKCRHEGEKLKYINLVEVINKIEYKVKEGHSYADVVRFKR